jgi:hypothetical protein
MPQPRGGKVSPPNDNYTAILAVAVGVLLATMVYVAYMCQADYGTIFGMP